jgi:hypothetical protein
VDGRSVQNETDLLTMMAIKALIIHAQHPQNTQIFETTSVNCILIMVDEMLFWNSDLMRMDLIL